MKFTLHILTMQSSSLQTNNSLMLLNSSRTISFFIQELSSNIYYKMHSLFIEQNCYITYYIYNVAIIIRKETFSENIFLFSFSLWHIT